MNVLVTGADGFVGKWVCAELLSRGHAVIGAVRSLDAVALIRDRWRDRLDEVQWVPMELSSESSIEEALKTEPETVIHLAAIASGAEARVDPVKAWQVNCMGTCSLVYAIQRLSLKVRLLLVSTGEVYGSGLTRPAHETDPLRPCSPYAASKAAAEVAVSEYHRRSDADVLIARPFAQAGPGQREQFVVSAFAHRLLDAKQRGEHAVRVGNLEPIREFLDVRDVSVALCLLMEKGQSGDIYNIAGGTVLSLSELLAMIAEEVGWKGDAIPDQQFFRRADIPYLVGDGSRIKELGWSPTFHLRQTIHDLVEDSDS